MQRKHLIIMCLKALGPSSDQNLPESNLKSAIINKALTILVMKGRPRSEEAKTTELLSFIISREGNVQAMIVTRFWKLILFIWF